MAAYAALRLAQRKRLNVVSCKDRKDFRAAGAIWCNRNMNWISDEMIFYAGAVITVGALLAGILFWRIRKKRSVLLRLELEQEYGENKETGR